MYKILKQIVFLYNVFFIIMTEIALYYIFHDYNKFIDGLTLRLSSINILYVKVFQAIALNNSLIDDKINNKLLKFTDNAPWTQSDINLEELIELTNDYNINLNKGYEKPINSGMISLVFQGYKRENGEKIIIKMKRNNIEYKLNEAIENLKTFMYLLSFIPLIKKYQIQEVINKNIDIITHQTNFSKEIQNMIKIKNNCKRLKYVKIPNVYPEITNKYKNFIVMEYIEGCKINEIEEKDYEEFAKNILKFGFVTTIVHGVTHGDLHSGNILFIKDEKDKKYKYKIGVIDFGIIFELNDDFKNFGFDLVTKIFEIPPRETALKVLNSGIIDPPGIFSKIPNNHRENIINRASQLIEESISSSKKANQLQLYKFLHEFKNYLSNPEISNIGIRLSDNFVKTQLVLAMAHGITLTLCKEDYMALADQVVNELFHTKMIT